VRICNFADAMGREQIGLGVDKGSFAAVSDLKAGNADLAPALGTIHELIGSVEAGLAALRKADEYLKGLPPDRLRVLSFSEVQMLVPVKPKKFFSIAVNSRSPKAKKRASPFLAFRTLFISRSFRVASPLVLPGGNPQDDRRQSPASPNGRDQLN